MREAIKITEVTWARLSFNTMGVLVERGRDIKGFQHGEQVV